eukprot:s1446_g1.t1
MSPDWIPNEAIICIYDAANREFLWSNRAYASSRKTYNEQVKAHIDAGTTLAHALQQSKIGIAKDSLSAQWGKFLRGVRPGRFFTLNPLRTLTGVYKDMETDAKTEAVELKNYVFALYAAVSNSDVIIRQRRGKGYGGKGKGHGSLPGGKAADVLTQIKLENLRTEHCIAHQKIAIPYVNCEKCGHRQLDGLAKCESCYVSQESWPDSRIATEVCRLESRAEEISGSFSIDQISSQQPRRHRLGSEKRQKSRAGRSNFGVMKDGARNEIRKLRKTGFASIRQRLEGDPFFMYNCSLAQLTPPACDFLHRLGTCLSPDSGRSFTARDQGKGTDIRTRLIFMPKPYRDPSTPLDVSTESMICHSGRFFSLAQFAVYTAKLAPARGEPAPTVYGWFGMMLVLDEQPVKENYDDLVDFAKTNWTDHHGAMQWEQHTTEPEAVASEVKNFPEAFGPKKQEGMIDRPKRNFDPRTTESFRPAARSWGSSTYYENGCYICGSPDHWQRDCPQKKGGWQSGKGYGGGRWERWSDDRQWGYGGKGYGYREYQSQQRSKGKGSGQKGRGYRDQGYNRTYSGRSYPGGSADRERSPPPTGGAASSADAPALPHHRPGGQTRRIDAVTSETRTHLGVVRECTMQDPDGTMYTEYTFPDGHEDVNVNILPVGSTKPCDVFALGLLGVALAAGKEICSWGVVPPEGKEFRLAKPFEDYLRTLLDLDSERRLKAQEAVDKLPEDTRWLIAKKVFQSLRGADGLVDARTLRARFSASKHPDVEAGLKDAKEVYQEVMTQITSRNGRISLSDFAKYYEHLSAGIQDNKYFSHILRRSWGLATTPGNIMARNAHRMYEGHIRSTEGGLCGL